MPGKGLQFLPFQRIPAKWDPVWYGQHLREVLALADTRNAIEGSGITITGQPDELATISASDDLQNLLLQQFVLAAPSGFLSFERVLAGETDVVDITDGGANSTITISIAANGINLGKIQQLSGYGLLGNPTDTLADVSRIAPTADGQALAVTGGVIGWTSTPTWGGSHTWLDNAAVILGTGGDLTITHNGTTTDMVNTTGVLTISSTAGVAIASSAGEVSIAGETAVVLAVNGADALEITDDGEWLIGGSAGTAGYVPTSAGAGAPVTWAAQTGGSGLTSIKQTTSLSITSNAAFQTTQLTTSLAAGIYRVAAQIWCDVNTTPDMEIQFQYTGTVTHLNGHRDAWRMTVPATSTDVTTSLADTVYLMNDTSRFYVEYRFLVDVSTSGTFAVYARQVTSSGTAVAFLAGSSMLIEQIV